MPISFKAFPTDSHSDSHVYEVSKAAVAPWFDGNSEDAQYRREIAAKARRTAVIDFGTQGYGPLATRQLNAPECPRYRALTVINADSYAWFVVVGGVPLGFVRS